MEKTDIQNLPEKSQETLDNHSIEEKRRKAPSSNSSLKSIQDSVLPGLTAEKKFVPHWYQYDELGCEFFDLITLNNPYYHIYRAEESILKEYAEEMAALFRSESEVVISELGAGNSTKTTYLFKVFLEQQKKVELIPIDVAKEYMEESAKSLRETYSNLVINPFVGDFAEGIEFLKGCSKSLVFMILGNTISNIPLQDIIPFLKHTRNSMKAEDCFLVGIDLNQDPEKVKKGYTHLETLGPFRKNILTRLNHDFDANFNLDDFDIYFNYVISEDTSVFRHPQYTQGGVQCLRDHVVNLKAVGKMLEMKKGDVIHHHELENASLKWSWSQFTELIEKAGFRLEKKWSDQNCSYGVGCLKIK